LDTSSAAEAEQPDEDARIQAFLDARYTAADVRYSYKTRAGEVIDCIDFFAYPSLPDAPMLRCASPCASGGHLRHTRRLGLRSLRLEDRGVIRRRQAGGGADG